MRRQLEGGETASYSLRHEGCLKLGSDPRPLERILVSIPDLRELSLVSVPGFVSEYSWNPRVWDENLFGPVAVVCEVGVRHLLSYDAVPTRFLGAGTEE